MSDISRPSRSQSRAAAGSPQPSPQPQPQPQPMGPPVQQRPASVRASGGFDFLAKIPSPVVAMQSAPHPSDTPSEESTHKKKRSPSPLANYMDRIPPSQRVVRSASEDYERASRVAETISVESQSTEVPPAGDPTPAEALEMPDTMDIDDTGGSAHHLFGPLEVDTPKRKDSRSSFPRMRPSRSAPSTRIYKHAMGISLPVLPMPEDLGSVESRMERCKMRIADVWDDLREMRGRVQVVNDTLLKALHDMEALVKYLE
ncbi:hypothetical protein EDB85DRAFT_1899985 [Lactarius pseudohatsudake]|nr:hypothetical protein EDB85DRAFT_1899985 [Lactarius pseudohatsudake]